MDANLKFCREFKKKIKDYIFKNIKSYLRLNFLKLIL